MITESILHFLNLILNPILDLIPVMSNFVIPDKVLGYLSGIFSAIGYLIPVAELLPILIFSIAFTGWRFGYSVICRLRSLF